MDLRISKESGAPLREQVFTQLAFLIGTRKLKPGDFLPSVRALARQLRIHHNTVSQAYQDLAAQGFLIRRRGSRLLVRSPETPLQESPKKDLDDLINQAIQAARQQGFTLQQLRDRVRQRLLDAPPDHVLVLSTDAEILGVLRRELEEALAWPVGASSPAEIAANPALLVGALVLSAPGALPGVLTYLPKNRPALPILYSDPGEQLALVRRLKKPSLIAVVSVSRFFLDMARGMLTPLLGSRHSMREYLVAPPGPWDIGAADVTFCDCIAHRALRRARGKSLVPYRLISPQCIRQIQSIMAAS